MNIRTMWTCPECQAVNNTLVDVTKSGSNMELRRCDLEQGGCDNLVALETNVFTMSTAFILTDADSGMTWAERKEVIKEGAKP